MKDRLEKSIASSRLVKLYVDVEGDEAEYTGIPIRASRSLLAFHDLEEFHFNGYVVVRLRDIVKVRRSRFETTQQKILKSTSELAKHADLPWLRLGSWKSLLSCLRKRGVCVCASSGLMAVNAFAIGEIHRLTDDAVVLRSFDAHGKWCSPMHRIRYADLTEVSFGDEYSTTFHEFVKSG